ncbi:sensor histidine kinase [Acuticoccus yangtzensis]|uniref:sensor histidine kinase n=1 Tax=Acuticoccus yangtzensis TaxID=1443441 RepID=UPI000A53F315|nr:histidine kinase dimerization/phosphoacceptor domain -containing protein [Acuticoccus yangtzensis]
MVDIAEVLREIEATEIVATLREGLLILTEELVVEYASPGFVRTFAVDHAATLGRHLADLGNGQWNVAELLRVLEQIVGGGPEVEGFEVEHTFEQLGRRVMHINARKTVRPGNGSRRILMVVSDVTDAVDAAREVDRQRRLAQGIVDTLREPLLVLDAGLGVVEASRAFYRTFAVDDDQTIGRPLAALGNGQWAIPELIELLTDVIPDNTTIEDFEVRHVFPQIGEKAILLNARKVYREGNHSATLLLAMEDVTERRRLEAERAAAAGRAERLLEELNHRVMNSLSTISSIISFEGRTLADEECRTAFERMRRRIFSVGTLYRALTKSGSVDTVDANAYLSSVARDIAASMSGRSEAVRLELDLEAIELSTQLAVPIALIVNELFTNSLKYAYGDGRYGILGLSLKMADERTMVLTIWDDGPGINPTARVDSGLGQRLVEAFLTQLGATMKRESDASGTRFYIAIPYENDST